MSMGFEAIVAFVVFGFIVSIVEFIKDVVDKRKDKKYGITSNPHNTSN